MHPITGLVDYDLKADGTRVKKVTPAGKPILFPLSPFGESLSWWSDLSYGKKNHFEHPRYRQLFMGKLKEYGVDCYFGLSHILAQVISSNASELLAQVFLIYPDVSVMQQNVHEGVPAGRNPKTFSRKEEPSYRLLDTNYRKPEYCKGDTRRSVSMLTLLAWQAVLVDNVVWSDLEDATKYPSYKKQSIAHWLKAQKEDEEFRSYLEELTVPLSALHHLQQAKSLDECGKALEELLDISPEWLFIVFTDIATELKLSHDSNQQYLWRYFLTHTQTYYKELLAALPDSRETVAYRAACEAVLVQLQKYNEWGGLDPTTYQWLAAALTQPWGSCVAETSSKSRDSGDSEATENEALLGEKSDDEDNKDSHRAKGGGRLTHRPAFSSSFSSDSIVPTDHATSLTKPHS